MRRAGVRTLGASIGAAVLALAGLLVWFAARDTGNRPSPASSAVAARDRPATAEPPGTPASRPAVLATSAAASNELTPQDVGSLATEVPADLSDKALPKALRRLELGNIEGFIKHPWPNGEPPYRESREFVTPESLPELHRMLNAPEWEPYWGTIAYMIAHVSTDEASVPILLDYVQRKQDFSSLEPIPAMRRAVPKVRVVRWLGRIGGEQATKALRTAITREGARKMTESWAGDPRLQVTLKGDTAASMLNAEAARGLVLTRDPANVAIVEQKHAVNTQLARKARGVPFKEQDYCRGGGVCPGRAPRHPGTRA